MTAGEGAPAGAVSGLSHGPGGGEPAGLVWLNGALMPLAEARVSPADRGLLVGDGAFETVEVVGGRSPFALTRHLHRLARSLDLLGLSPVDDDLLRGAVGALLGAQDQPIGRLRITVTAGTGVVGSLRTGGRPTVLVQTGPPAVHPPAATVTVVPWPRNERSPLTGVKSVSYGDNVVALAWAKQRGADEALFANTAGRLCEGAGSNVLVEQKGALVTPPLSAGCLPGVTRALLVELGVAEERDLSLSALWAAGEVALTSSTRGLQPVAAVDSQAVNLVPGPLTQAAQAAFAALRARTLDP